MRDLEELRSVMCPGAGLVVLDVRGDSPGPGTASRRSVDAVARDRSDLPIAFYRIWSHEHPQLARATGARCSPTVLFCIDGQIHDALVGRMERHQIDACVEELASRAPRHGGFFARLFGRRRSTA